MHKSFVSLEDLYSYMKEDKEWEGAEATPRNRYPVRFILFDDFDTFEQFVARRPEGVYKVAIDDLVDPQHPDIFPTFTEVSNTVKKYVKALPANDYIICPFSEMSRFYREEEFDAMVRTIKGISPTYDGQDERVRIYIPIIGMQGKMAEFMKDNQTYVWELKSSKESGVYNLILLPGSTYNISGLKSYTVVRSLLEWLQLWKEGAKVKEDIICTSKTIFANAFYAQPDNAFRYNECKNAFEFLTLGLKLDFGQISISERDLDKWEHLASIIDVENFSFKDFVKERFDAFSLSSSVDFIKTWFDCETDFDRWLLALYFRIINNDRGYICSVLNVCEDLNTSEFFSNVAIHIFDCIGADDWVQERRNALKEAQKYGVQLTYTAEQKLYAKLKAMMSGTPEHRYRAIQLLTSLTASEKCLAIEMLSEGLLTRKALQSIYPPLFHYLQPLGLQLPLESQWLNGYINTYKEAKIGENTTQIGNLLAQLNSSTTSFQNWLDNFKTVKTVLYNRSDIDVIYWIDGLGIDWIPFISYVICKHQYEKVYLNEIHIARAQLPTTTSINKAKLEEIIPNDQLKKIGDLDYLAHGYNKGYPNYIIDELQIVEEAISHVLSQYNGKKIAFVSDHGMTFLAQYYPGLNLAGIESHHDGRVAKRTTDQIVSDNKYVILEDGKTLCSLTHASLTTKTPKGHGAHGGATPEEVLVPIIIVSSQPNSCEYTIHLCNTNISAIDPVIKFEIRGLNTVDVPTIIYNSSSYILTKAQGDIYVSEKLPLVDTARKVSLQIGKYSQSFNISISTGVEENDLFG